MHKISTIIQWELRRGLRSKAFIVSMLMPFVVLLFSIVPTLFALNQKIGGKDVGIIDRGNGIYAEMARYLETEFVNDEGEAVYGIQEYRSTPANHDTLVQTLIRDGYAAIVLVLEPDFIERGGMKIYHGDQTGIEEISRLENAVEGFVMEKRIISLGLTREDMDYVLDKPDIELYEVGKHGDATRSNLIVRYGVPGVFLWLLVMGVVMSSSMLISGVIEERSNRIIEILMSSIRPGELMTGKIIGIGMLGVIQITVYLLILLAFTLFGGPALGLQMGPGDVFTVDILWYFLYFIMGYFMYASLYVGLGSLYDNERDAQQSVGFLTIFAVLPIMLIQPIMMNPETPLADVLSFIPLTTPFMMILKIGMLSAPFWEIILMMFYLLLWIGIITWAGSKIFRTTILMYGKRVTLKEIVQWIRA